MQGRSWMAAWLLTTVATVGISALAGTSWAAGPTAVKQKVQLNIRLDGVSAPSGVEILIKPGHPATRFKEVTYKVKQDGDIGDIPVLDVETVSADRDCSFAITLKEPGQPDKVFRRSLRINPPTPATAGKPEVAQSLKCFLSSRDVAAKVTLPRTRVVTKPTTTPIRK